VAISKSWRITVKYLHSGWLLAIYLNSRWWPRCSVYDEETLVVSAPICPDKQVCFKNVLLDERSRRIIYANFRVTFQILKGAAICNNFSSPVIKFNLHKIIVSAEEFKIQRDYNN
jgi:hypothetical protein